MNIFVGCGAKDSGNPEYRKTAIKLAHFICEKNHNLVFGGSDKGIMGLLYSIVSSSNNSNIFVAMCNAYKSELYFVDYKKYTLSDTVNERKNGYTRMSDALVFISGGFGTIDELMSAIESKRAYEHNLPIVVINTNGYFDPLLAMFEKIYHEGFADEKIRNLYYVAETVDDAIVYLESSFCNI